MTRILVVGLMALAAGVQAQPQGRGGPPWRFVGAEAGRPGPVVKGAPFSADVTTESTVALQDGNRIRQTSSLRVYRDSEGRTRREQSLNNVGGLTSNTNLPPVVFLSDPVAGVSYAVSPSFKTATRSVSGGRGFGQPGNRGGGRPAPQSGTPGMERRMRGGPNEPNPNVKTESLGRQTIEGVVADGTRTTIVVPAGQMGNEQALQTVIESWYSPDLQTVILSKRNDPRMGESITRYTNISRTEPAHSLFEVPADYKVTDSGARDPKTDHK